MRGGAWTSEDGHRREPFLDESKWAGFNEAGTVMRTPARSSGMRTPARSLGGNRWGTSGRRREGGKATKQAGDRGNAGPRRQPGIGDGRLRPEGRRGPGAVGGSRPPKSGHGRGQPAHSENHHGGSGRRHRGGRRGDVAGTRGGNRGRGGGRYSRGTRPMRSDRPKAARRSTRSPGALRRARGARTGGQRGGRGGVNIRRSNATTYGTGW